MTPALPDERPADHGSDPRLHPDLGSFGRLEIGSRSVQPPQRRYLAPWHWNALLAIGAAPDTWTNGTPLPLVRGLADEGLLTLQEEPGRHIASVTERGREALARGWYEVEDGTSPS